MGALIIRLALCLGATLLCYQHPNCEPWPAMLSCPRVTYSLQAVIIFLRLGMTLSCLSPLCKPFGRTRSLTFLLTNCMIHGSCLLQPAPMTICLCLLLQLGHNTSTFPAIFPLLLYQQTTLLLISMMIILTKMFVVHYLACLPSHLNIK